MSGTAEATVLAALNAVVRDHGWLVTNNPARLRATLSDVLGPDADQHRGLVDALVVSADEGVRGEVRAAGRAGLADVAASLTARLVDWGIAEERARWVVAAWSSLLPESTLDAATEPTALPASPYLAPTVLPPTTLPTPAQTPAQTGQTTGRRNRRGLVIGVAAAVLLALGGVAAAVTLTGEDKDPGSSTSDEPTDEPLPPASGFELVVSTNADVPFIKPVIMGGWRDGVALVALSPVPSLRDETGVEYAAPEGGSLIGFRLDDGKCDRPRWDDCNEWRHADLSVVIDGRSQQLPPPARPYGTATFIVAVPAGARSVALVMESEGTRQSISLFSGQPSSSNIAVLTRDKLQWAARERFRTIQRTNIPIIYSDDGTRRSITRRAKVGYYSLSFWFSRTVRASAPDRALLEVWADYRYPVPDGYRNWRSDEVRFRDAQGRLYRPVRMPGEKDSPWYDYRFFFDVPASITRGTLLLGGSIDVESQEGTPYTQTTPVTPVPLRLS